MADVTLPQLGETVTEGTITRWFKKVGDTVTADEALFEVSTDKVDTEVPSPVTGVVLEIRANEGDTVMHGHPEVPAPLPQGSRFWIAIEENGATATGSVAIDG